MRNLALALLILSPRNAMADSSPRPRSPFVAAALGLLPGAGQLYNGQAVKGGLFRTLHGAMLVSILSPSLKYRLLFEQGRTGGPGTDLGGLEAEREEEKGMRRAMIGAALGFSVLSAVDSALSARKVRGEESPQRSVAGALAAGIIPGAGQLSGGRPVRASILGAMQLSAAAGSIMSFLEAENLRAQARYAGPGTDLVSLEARALKVEGRTRAYVGAALGLTALSMVESAVSTKPRFDLGERKPAVAAALGLLPGAGAYYNGKLVRGGILGTLQATAWMAAASTYVEARGLESQFELASPGSDKTSLSSALAEGRRAHRNAMGAALGLTLLSVIDSGLGARKKAPEISLSARPGGWEAGYQIRF